MKNPKSTWSAIAVSLFLQSIAGAPLEIEHLGRLYARITGNTQTVVENAGIDRPDYCIEKFDWLSGHFPDFLRPEECMPSKMYGQLVDYKPK